MSGGTGSRCMRCKQPRAIVLETRQVGTTTRRRRRCTACGHRCTTYELQQDEWQQLTTAAALLQRIEKTLLPLRGRGASPLEPDHAIPCHTCRYVVGDDCSFGFPEYGTTEAKYCVMREIAQDDHYPPIG